MNDPASRVGFVTSGDPTPEQRAAIEWCAETGAAVETLSLSSVASGEVDLADCDVLWWHADESVAADPALERAADPIRSYVDAGGGLLLSLRAQEAVPALGIDPVAPDATGVDHPETTIGLLCKSLYDDHPAFDGFDDLRVPTRSVGGPQPYARYDDVLPERGDVLASTIRDADDVAHQPALIGWSVGDGGVAGLGTALTFAGDTTEPCERNRARLLENLLSTLAADAGSFVDGRPKDADALSAMRSRLSDDPNRPKYHVSPPANWLNDPNGLIHWDGQFHVFYQYNPGGPYHDTIHWGHAVSDDLVRWRDEPVALTPSPDGPDRDGCWSGCAFDNDGEATILYTGGRGDEQLPCLATAVDQSLRRWEKSSANPVISELPEEPPLRSTDDWVAEFRDHNVWYENGRWQQLIGSGVENGGGTALLYTAGDDLTDWRYEGPILTGDPERDGAMWECPELLDLGAKRLLHISNYEEVRYYLGEYDDGEFEVETTGLLDHGDFYAPQSMRTDDGRWLTWGWCWEARDESAQWDAGWSGTLSLPRRVELDDDGRLRQRPAAELAELRERRLHEGGVELTDERRELGRGRSIELRAEVRLEDADEFSITVCESGDGEERTPIRYTRDSHVEVDRTESSADPRSTKAPERMPVSPVDGPLELTAYLDGSVLELFVNERHCLTTRIYPTAADADRLSVAATGGTATVESLDVWELGSAWERDERAASAVEPAEE